MIYGLWRLLFLSLSLRVCFCEDRGLWYLPSHELASWCDCCENAWIYSTHVSPSRFLFLSYICCFLFFWNRSLCWIAFRNVEITTTVAIAKPLITSVATTELSLVSRYSRPLNFQRSLIRSLHDALPPFTRCPTPRRCTELRLFSHLLLPRRKRRRQQRTVQPKRRREPVLCQSIAVSGQWLVQGEQRRRYRRVRSGRVHGSNLE